MRVLTADFVNQYRDRLINIHPSLLPAFPGLHTHRQALAAGVRVHGCTVHFVTPQLDHGPIIIQAAVPVLPGDDEDKLAARVLAEEHRIYPQAVRWLCEDRVTVTADGRVVIAGVQNAGGTLLSPPPDAEQIPHHDRTWNRAAGARSTGRAAIRTRPIRCVDERRADWRDARCV